MSNGKVMIIRLIVGLIKYYVYYILIIYKYYILIIYIVM